MTWIRSNFKIFPFICSVLTAAVVFTLFFGMERINYERSISHYYVMFSNEKVFTFERDLEAGGVTFAQGDRVRIRWADYAEGVTVRLDDGTLVEGVPIDCFAEKDQITAAIDNYEQYKASSQEKLAAGRAKNLLKSLSYSAFAFLILNLVSLIIKDKRAASVVMAAVLVLAVFGALGIVTQLR